MKSKLVTLCTYRLSQQADFARWALEQEGIQACVPDKHAVAANWLTGDSLGWIRVQVDETDSEAAMAILSKYPRLMRIADDADTDQIIDSALVCMVCEKSLEENVERCESCGWSYLDQNDETDPDSKG